MKTYLFYDVETTGLNSAFDQILTFAYIRTDLNLEELDRKTITIRMRKDIVPSPKAFLTHGLTQNELKQGINEYDAALKIHTILNTPETVSLGYNSLGFDDEFLRFMFYRNLLDPYKHQYNSGCSRMDILPLTVIYKVFHPDSLKWPQAEGKPSLKLELISSENQFETSGKAHEAMNDVEAVIELTKRLSQNKAIWEYCLEFFNKTRDEVRVNTIKDEFCVQNKRFKVCLMVSASFGAKVNYLAPVVCLGQSIVFKNQSLWLRLDLDDILGLDTGAQFSDTFVIRKRAGDQLIILPSLDRFWRKLAKPMQESAAENLEKIKHHWERFFDFIDYHCEYKYPFIPDMDLDAALYQDGFFSAQERKQSDMFHKALSDLSLGYEKKDILNKIKIPRIKKIANRILARNFEGQDLENTEYLSHLSRLKSSKDKDQIIGYRNDLKFNRVQGLQELKEIEQKLLHPDRDQSKMIEWLKGYFK